MRLPFSLLLLTLAAVLGGCVAAGPVGFQKFEPRPDNAVLYVYRESKIPACGISDDVYIDSKKVGELPNGSYLVSFLAPGHHTVEVKFSAINSLWYKDSKKEIDVKPGTQSFLLFDVTMTSLTIAPVSMSTWSTGLREATAEEAEQAINKLRINNAPDTK
jgi:hypothetical protein